MMSRWHASTCDLRASITELVSTFDFCGSITPFVSTFDFCESLTKLVPTFKMSEFIRALVSTFEFRGFITKLLNFVDSSRSSCRLLNFVDSSHQESMNLIVAQYRASPQVNTSLWVSLISLCDIVSKALAVVRNINRHFGLDVWRRSTAKFGPDNLQANRQLMRRLLYASCGKPPTGEPHRDRLDESKSARCPLLARNPPRWNLIRNIFDDR